MHSSLDPPWERAMSKWSATSRRCFPAVLCCAIVAALPAAAASNKDNKPSIAVKSSPLMGFAPFRVVLTAEVNGGPDDYEQYYCASVEWDMGDGIKAEEQQDCDPYEVGKSQIKRRYVREQVFNTPGEFRVTFKLKKKNKVVGTGATMIRVRPGARDGDEIIRLDSAGH
jgi:hypothetical protein